MRLGLFLYSSIDICVSSSNLYGWIDICVSSIYMYGVQLIFVRFNIDICGSLIYMYAVRFVFVQFYLFFAILILNERVSLYLGAFHILSVTEPHTLLALCHNLKYSLPRMIQPQCFQDNHHG